MHSATFARAASIALVLLAAGLAANPARAQKKDDEPERARMLLIFAPNETDKALISEFDQLQQDTAEVNSEEVDVVYVIGDQPVKLPPPDAKTDTADNLRKHYHVDATGFRIVLVGQDGWEKARWSEPTDPHKILMHAEEMPKPKDPAH